MKNLKDISLQNDAACPSAEELVQYVENSLTTQDHHKLESHIIDCPLCEVAVEGISIMGDKNEYLTLSKSFLKEGVADSSKSSFFATTDWRILAAAAVLVLFLFSGLIYFMGVDRNSNELVLNEERPATEKQFNENSALESGTENQAIVPDIKESENPITESNNSEAEDSEISAPIQNLEILQDDFDNASANGVPPAPKAPEVEAPSKKDQELKNNKGRIQSDQTKTNTTDLGTTSNDSTSLSPSVATSDKTRSEKIVSESINPYLNNNVVEKEETTTSNRRGGLFKRKKNVAPEAEDDIVELEDPFTAAQVLYSNKRYEEALNSLKKAPNNDDAKWLKSKIFLAQDKLEEAIPILEGLAAKKGEYQDKAKKELETL